jgi:hypothetical protein
MPSFCFCSTQLCGRARASDVTARSAGAVPLAIASTTRGRQIGEGSKIPDVPLDLALAFGDFLEGAPASLGEICPSSIAPARTPPFYQEAYTSQNQVVTARMVRSKVR